MIPVQKFSEGKIPISAFNMLEINHMKQFHCKKRRYEWICGRYAAKLALKKLFLKNSDSDYYPMCNININSSSNNKNVGQPLCNMNSYISISHSHDWAVAVASNNMVGIDIEKIRKFSQPVKNMVFTTRELYLSSNVKINKNEDITLTFCWCLKEAFMKTYGLSVFNNFMDIELRSINNQGKLKWDVSTKLQEQLLFRDLDTLTGYVIELNGYALVVIGEKN